MLRVGAAGLATFQIRVPIDDENTWHVWYQTYRPDGGAPPQPEVPVYEVPLKDERGEWRSRWNGWRAARTRCAPTAPRTR